jgi:hypothetical protein
MPDRARLVAECDYAFRQVKEARGMNAVLAALEAASAALGELVLNADAGDQEIRAMVARIGTFHRLASDIRKIG